MEFAIVGPVLVVLALGLLEFGYAFRVHTVQTQASAASARVAAGAGFDGLADYVALESIAAGLGGLGGQSTVERVVIYDPTAVAWTDGTCRTMAIPSAGHTGVTGACNIYGGDVLDSLGVGHFTGSAASCPNGKWDKYLCPLLRDADPDGGGTMRLGVYVKVTHDMLTSLFPPGTTDMTEDFEMCVEPAGSDAVVPSGNTGDTTGSCDGVFG